MFINTGDTLPTTGSIIGTHSHVIPIPVCLTGAYHRLAAMQTGHLKALPRNAAI